MRVQRQLFIAVLVGVGFTGCMVNPEDLDPELMSDSQEINLKSCEGADVPCLPKPDKCTGPDSAGWSNKPRPADAGPCPAPPTPAGCTQYVIGRQKDVEKYINCPGYNVLNRDDYNQRPGLNDLFIACAACGNATCNPGILIASGNEQIPDHSNDGGPWSSTELCQLNKYCTVTTNNGAVGSVTNCNCEKMANDCGPKDGGTPDSGTPDSGTPDSGTPDAGGPDSGTPDSGTLDAGPRDAGSF
ncbi:hypothetical protein [Archangium violaceum]|uniref:hypothetical protein n=1 Tax=Archangium violaceum TaxID=83451 RepID=UPI0036DD430D